MSQVSKRALPKDIQERVIHNFLEMLSDIKNVKDFQLFVEDFLSPTEKIMLAKRMAIAILFSKGYNHRDISNVLKVSTTTVNNIARYIHDNSQGYKILINKYSQKQNTKELFQELERYLYRLSSPGKTFVNEGLIKAKLGHRNKMF